MRSEYMWKCTKLWRCPSMHKRHTYLWGHMNMKMMCQIEMQEYGISACIGMVGRCMWAWVTTWKEKVVTLPPSYQWSPLTSNHSIRSQVSPMTVACLCSGSGGEMVIVQVCGVDVFDKDGIHLCIDEQWGGGIFAWAQSVGSGLHSCLVSGQRLGV